MSRIAKLQEFIVTQKLMTLATLEDKVWTANVYFVSDDKLSIYFISSQHSRHSVHISSNPWVSFAMAWFDDKDPFKNRKGIQGVGVCGEVLEEEEAKRLFEIFKVKFPQYDRSPEEFVGKENEFRFYKINPDVIKYWDDENFGEGGSEEFNFMRNIGKGEIL